MAVPDCKREIPSQMMDALRAPRRISMKNQFGVRSNAATASSRLLNFLRSSSRLSSRASAVIQSCPSRLAGCCSFSDSRVVRSAAFPNPIAPSNHVSLQSGPQYARKCVTFRRSALCTGAPLRSKMPAIALNSFASPSRIRNAQMARNADARHRRHREPFHPAQPTHAPQNGPLLSSPRCADRRSCHGAEACGRERETVPGNLCGKRGSWRSQLQGARFAAPPPKHLPHQTPNSTNSDR